MRLISAAKIINTVSRLCIEANLVLPAGVLLKLKGAYAKETNKRAKQVLKAIIDNAAIARKEKLAICQDTGMPVVFAEIGEGARVPVDLTGLINKGIEIGYRKANLRNSVVLNPLERKSPAYSPGIIHFNIVKGNKIRFTVLPKGFGCENKTQLKMFRPTAKISEIKEFIVDAVKSAGADACPPYIVGAGIGGTADYAAFLAKKALLRPITNERRPTTKLEQDLLREINKLNIGPMGLGGKTTALSVNIETYPTHIAGLPVVVNISCHALRSATAVI